MLTLQEVQEKTTQIFEQADGMGTHNLVVPTPPIIWKDKLNALEEENLLNKRAALLFDMRKWQVTEMGFKEIKTPELVEMLMGEPHTEEIEGKTRQNYEWAYNHHTDELLGKDWGGMPAIYNRVVRTGLWHLPPFAKKTVWTCQSGRLDYLKREIPYGVILRINECKKLKLFNVFNVIAPKEAWENETEIDPIVVATIWELPFKASGKNDSAGQTAHFFLAQW